MWQDALVTMIAISAIAVLGRRWLKARSRPAGACPSCSSVTPCAPTTDATKTPDAKPITFYR